MKLSTLLDTVISTKFEIVDVNFKNYIVDYTSGILKPEDYGAFQEHGSKATLPKKLLSREVKFVDSYGGELHITLK